MFDLDREVHAWCRSIHTTWFNRDARVEELKDHLYCEIERLRAEGLSDEQAFLYATERLGSVDELLTEHAKNRHWLVGWRDSMSLKKAASLIIAISLLFAAAIILSSYLLNDTQYEQHSQTVVYLLIALWWIPYSILIAGLGGQSSIKAEVHCIKRKVSGLLNHG